MAYTEHDRSRPVIGNARCLPLNWLAHSYLGGADPVDRIANLSGDFVRGMALDDLDARIRAGVLAHRAIDAFTDAHACVRRSLRRIDGPLRRFAGPLVDVFYDHFLARHWDRLTDAAPLPVFVGEVYAALREHAARLPPRLRAIAPRMAADDWLGSYGTLDGIEGILRRMEGRLRRPVPLADGVHVLRAERDGFERDFESFFPAVVGYVTRAAGSPGGP